MELLIGIVVALVAIQIGYWIWEDKKLERRRKVQQSREFMIRYGEALYAYELTHSHMPDGEAERIADEVIKEMMR